MLSYTAYRLQLAAWLNCNWGGGVDCFLCISNTFIWKGIVKLSWVLEGGFKNVSHSILYWFLCIFNTFMSKSTKRAFHVWTHRSSFSGGVCQNCQFFHFVLISVHFQHYHVKLHRKCISCLNWPECLTFNGIRLFCKIEYSLLWSWDFHYCVVCMLEKEHSLLL